jgi:hypothetical protein
LEREFLCFKNLFTLKLIGARNGGERASLEKNLHRRAHRNHNSRADLFLLPCMFNGINGLGAVGKANATITDNTNTALVVTLAVCSILAGIS